jgi:hypothetical protein
MTGSSRRTVGAGAAGVGTVVVIRLGGLGGSVAKPQPIQNLKSAPISFAQLAHTRGPVLEVFRGATGGGGAATAGSKLLLMLTVAVGVKMLSELSEGVTGGVGTGLTV